jgi:putative tryptophan/tyrosine transport system substrate-binding protein
MRRRDFITLLGGAAAGMPLATRAQQAPLPAIGFLSSLSPGDSADTEAAFHQSLTETGFIEGRDVAIEYRWAEGRYDRLPTLAAELVARRVAVIVTHGATPPALAAKAATSTIPIVFTTGSDPVATGLVASLSRPGGNATGLFQLTNLLVPKRLELLHEVVPTVDSFAFLVNPTMSDSPSDIAAIESAAHVLGLRVHVLNASSEADWDGAFTTLVQRQAHALVVGNDPRFRARRDQIVALTARSAVPAIFNRREFVTAGGLMSYDASIVDAYRLAGIYTGRILKGEKPADLPVQQVTKVELVINLKTAKTLGVTFPLTLLGRADDVIE